MSVEQICHSTIRVYQWSNKEVTHSGSSAFSIPALTWQKQEGPEVDSIICIFTGLLRHSEEVVAL
jgi:hypothetical protein